MIKKIIPLVAITGFSIFAFYGCKENEHTVAGRQAFVIPDSICSKMKLDTVTTCPVAEAITLTGTVDFDQDHQINVFPLVSGNAQEVKVQPGDQVKAGQVLAVVKSSEMAGYSNSLITAESNLTVAKKNLDAQKDLFKSGLSSQLEVTAAQSNYDQAMAQLEMIRRVLKINGNNTQGDYIIKSPIDGFVVQRNITNNTSIRPDNGTNLFTISDLRQVWVQANVYESNIDKVHVGDSVTVTTVSYPDKIFHGKIDKIMNVLDPSSKVMKVRIVLSNPGFLLKPQMFARVVLNHQLQKTSVCVSAHAIVFDHSQNYVLVYHGHGSAEIRPVEVISTVGDKAYLSGGVQNGESLIASDTILIYDALNN